MLYFNGTRLCIFYVAYYISYFQVLWAIVDTAGTNAKMGEPVFCPMIIRQVINIYVGALGDTEGFYVRWVHSMKHEPGFVLYWSHHFS